MKLMKETRRAKMKLSQKMYLLTAMATSALCAVPAPLASAKGKAKKPQATAKATAKTGKALVNNLMNEKGNGTFDNATQVTQDVGGSIYVFMRNIGAICLVVSLATLGLYIAMHAGEGQKMSEGKDSMVSIVEGSLLVFSAMSFIAMIIGFAGSL